ncbi:MAG TPA: RidA family protein [Telluria sp.]|nr:RidA family protein [Telluria sp.]
MHTTFTLPRLVMGLTLLAAASAHADDIKRNVAPGGTIPIARAVSVPANTRLVFLSGNLADVSNPDAPKGSYEAYGDTQTQTLSVLKKIEALLASEGLGMGDVVKVNVFLAGDPKLDGKMDFAGLNASFSQFFGTAAQPNKPVRTALQVAALPMPGGLVEIEMTAAKVVTAPAPKKKK